MVQMARGDKDFRLLLSIMKRLGESREEYAWLHTRELIGLIPVERQKPDPKEDTIMLDGYLRFLEQKGYVELGTPVAIDLNRTARLTAAGEIFVQPELAQIDNPSILPQLIEAIEKQVLTYPEEVRDGFLFRFKDAIARNSPELGAKMLVEVLPKLLSGTLG
jgi:hypothetical protein